MAWDVINDRIGGHHPEWDCFRHPANKKIKTDYRKRLKRSDDYLSRTLLINTPFKCARKKMAAELARINKALKKL